MKSKSEIKERIKYLSKEKKWYKKAGAKSTVFMLEDMVDALKWAISK